MKFESKQPHWQLSNWNVPDVVIRVPGLRQWECTCGARFDYWFELRDHVQECGFYKSAKKVVNA